MAAPVHYLASNDSTWTPPAVLTLDTETRVIQQYPEIQELRCWHVRADYRLGRSRLAGEHVEGSGVDALDLARRISKWADRWAETWVYAHNLNFDLTVTKLPLLLANRGWQVTDMALDGARPWMILTHGNRKLVIADSYAIWPMKLEELGDAAGITKPPLPDGDDLTAWDARCAADTLILHTSLLQLMNYHDTNQLGRWAITGASTGWNSMRHLQGARTSKKARTARLAMGLPGVDPAAQPVLIDPAPTASPTTGSRSTGDAAKPGGGGNSPPASTPKSTSNAPTRRSWPKPYCPAVAAAGSTACHWTPGSSTTPVTSGASSPR